MRRLLVLSLRHRIICSHQTIEALRCHSSCMSLIRCLLAVIVIVIVLVIIIWFGNRLNDCSCYTIWLTILKSERPKTQSHPADESRTYIQPSIRIHLRKPAGSFIITPRPFAVSTTQGRRASIYRESNKSWCWRPERQAWPRPVSRLPITLLVAPPVAFHRAWGTSPCSITTGSRKALISKSSFLASRPSSKLLGLGSVRHVGPLF